MSYAVSELYTYPVKSLRGVSLENVSIDDFGVAGDRRFMWVDDEGCFVTQRKHAILSQVSAIVSGQDVLIRHAILVSKGIV